MCYKGDDGICKNVNKTGGYYSWWSKSDTEKYFVIWGISGIYKKSQIHREPVHRWEGVRCVGGDGGQKVQSYVGWISLEI